MKKTITIKPVTRIAGHAKVKIQLDDRGKVKDAHFHVLEFYGFEKFCEGRAFWEMPVITPRICGICSVSHHHAAVKATDAILGVEVPPAAQALRELAHAAGLLEDHALHFFYLAAPDFLLNDAKPSERSIFGILNRNPELASKGIELRTFGREILERLSGERTHINFMVPGGVNSTLSPQDRKAISHRIDKVIEDVQSALDLIKDFFERKGNELELGKFSSGYLGLVGKRGEFELCKGKLRLLASDGKILEEVEPAEYLSIIEEYVNDWSYLKQPYYKKLGRPDGMYRVGPLARLNVADSISTPLANEELLNFKQLSRNGVVEESFHYHYARVIEMLYAAERIRELLEEEIPGPIRANSRELNEEGIGVVEAPRGVLIHHYWVDQTGKIQKVNFIVPTTSNSAAIDRALVVAAKGYVKGERIEERILNRIEAAIRCYDPCLSCGTHALGQMPLNVQLISPEGKILDEITRG